VPYDRRGWSCVGWRPLHHAAERSDVNLVKLLLQNGADPTALTDNGLTALQIASKGISARTVAMIKSGGTICGDIPENEHPWNGCKCTSCGVLRSAGHKWQGCKCTVCGTTEHKWDKYTGKCAKCSTLCSHETWIYPLVDNPDWRKCKECRLLQINWISGDVDEIMERVRLHGKPWRNAPRVNECKHEIINSVSEGFRCRDCHKTSYGRDSTWKCECGHTNPNHIFFCGRCNRVIGKPETEDDIYITIRKTPQGVNLL